MPVNSSIPLPFPAGKGGTKRLFLIAGEASGDVQAACLVRELRKLIPNLECRGLGGAHMRAAGVDLLHDLTKEAVLGLGDVLKKYFFFSRIFRAALNDVERFKPHAVILIDYPGFNLRFAKRIGKRFPILYYVSPQIWAWGKRRIHTIRRTIDHMIVFFEFEAKLYEDAGVPVTWVGHPLVDLVQFETAREPLRLEWLGTNEKQKNLVVLFPGSRETEVRRILPEMLKAACAIHARKPNTQFFISQSNTLPSSLYEEAIEHAKPTFVVKLISNRSYDLFHAGDFALVSSGTATLEAALSSVPFVILYKTAWSTFVLARHLIQIPFIGLVNVVAGRKIVPEFIQHEIQAETIAQEACYLLDHEDLRRKMIFDLNEVRGRLGPKGAAARAALAVQQFLDQAILTKGQAVKPALLI
ncbi:MAG: lipid-A-disaccharide synthase [Omnitrophica bacterium RIFCSPLOWO2_01_FULL_50_24]|nr:MAG: lipid-A-disaccharide synthase [Omnitrophica bacterium RIFCSPLOWO2_01_FULL_50_24]